MPKLIINIASGLTAVHRIRSGSGSVTATSETNTTDSSAFHKFCRGGPDIMVTGSNEVTLGLTDRSTVDVTLNLGTPEKPANPSRRVREIIPEYLGMLGRNFRQCRLNALAASTVCEHFVLLRQQVDPS